MLRRLNLFQYFLPCCLLGLMLVGLGGKLWLIFNFGSPVPDPAQWRSGLPELVPEWAQGNVVLSKSATPTDFPLLARATLGALLHANRQWDDRITTVLNAALLAGTFALLLAAGARRLSWIAIWAAAVGAGLFLALPLGWEQSLAGSALPDRLALLLALPAAWALLDRNLTSAIWWLAALSLLAANTAADWVVVVSFTVGGVAALRTCTTRVRRGRDLAVLGLTAVGIVAHLWFYPGRLATLHWPSFMSLTAALAEPWTALPGLSLILLGPLAIRLAIAARDGDRKHSLAPFAALFAAGVLTILWLAAAGAPRRWGTMGAVQDLLFVLIALSFATLTQLWHLRWQSLPVRTVFTVAWIAVLVTGLHLRVENALVRDLPARLDQDARRQAVIEHTLRPAAGAADPTAANASLPAQDNIAAVLHFASPQLRALLPVNLQSTVTVQSGPATTDDFAPLQRNQFSLPTPNVPAWAGGPAAQAEGGTVFISLPLPPSATGVLRFSVAGDLGTARFPFALRSTRTGELVPLELDTSTGERWRTVNLVRPADPVVIVAGPAALGTWGAFTHPVEMGRWSWYAAKLAKNWALFLAAGGFVFLGALLLPLAPRSPRRETFELDHNGRVRIAAEDEE